MTQSGLLKYRFPDHMDYVNLYFIADTHIGSPDCNMMKVRRTINHVLNDPVGYVILGGDLMDNAIFGSPSNAYTQRLSPHEQIQAVCEYFRPLADAGKVLGTVPGNHENRSNKTAGLCPGEIIAGYLGIADRYSPTALLIQIEIGGRKYHVYSSHGNGGGSTIGNKVNQIEKLTRIVDADVYFAGHTHEPFIFFRNFLRINPDTGEQHLATRIFANCGACLNYRGSYGEAAGYAPTAFGYPCVRFYKDGRDPFVSMAIQ